MTHDGRLARQHGLLLGALLAAMLALALLVPRPDAGPATGPAPGVDLPLTFVANHGQTDSRVRFYAQAPGFSAWFTRDHVAMTIGRRAVELRFDGARSHSAPVGTDRRAGRVNYISESARHTGIPTFGAVTYRDLWPGIDLVFRTGHERLKYEFHVAAGADPAAIGLTYAGADSLALRRDGALAVQARESRLVDDSPRAMQGGAPVASRFELRGKRSYGFTVGAYDRTRPLLIDPGFAYSTFLGAANSTEDGERGRTEAIAVDGDGNAYVTGLALNPAFPTTPGAYNPTFPTTGGAAFVSKLNRDGSALEYSTFLARGSHGEDIAVDSEGNAYVTGRAFGPFPTTANAHDSTINGTSDLFLTKLDASGAALLYSTYLGGAGEGGEFAPAIAIGPGGDAFLTGQTDVADFPTTAGAYQGGPVQGSSDAFAARVSTSSGALVYSTLLGGSGFDVGNDIAVDGDGHAHVGGEASDQAFVTRLSADGSAADYSAVFGGSTSGSQDVVTGVALDDLGGVYASGFTWSPDFPTTPGALDTTRSTADDAFVVKLTPDGTGFEFATFLGYEGFNEAFGIAVDSRRRPVVYGNAGIAQFVDRLDPALSAKTFSDVVRGPIHGVAVDPGGNAYITGQAFEETFPVTPGALDTHFDYADSFVAKFAIGVGAPAQVELNPPAPTTSIAVAEHCVTAAVTDAAGQAIEGVTVDFTVTGAAIASGSQATDADGEAGFCYPSPEVPGTDEIVATAGGGLSARATNTWVAPASVGQCRVRASGRIVAPSGDEGSFSASIRRDGSGRVSYADSGADPPLRLRATAVDSIVCAGSEATIYGQARGESFKMALHDGPRTQDTFRIVLASGYDSGTRPLVAGSLRILGG